MVQDIGLEYLNQSLNSELFLENFPLILYF